MARMWELTDDDLVELTKRVLHERDKAIPMGQSYSLRVGSGNRSLKMIAILNGSEYLGEWLVPLPATLLEALEDPKRNPYGSLGLQLTLSSGEILADPDGG